MTIMNDLRAVLDNHLNTASGLPTKVYDNQYYARTPGTSFLEVQFRPLTRRPAVRGVNPSFLYTGMYRVLIHTPEDQGSGAALDIADAVMGRFAATTDILYNGFYVTIDYAELPGVNYIDAPFFVVPVNIGWYSYN